jgi:Acetyltransferases
MSITLRDVTAEDDLFLRKVYACTRARELSVVPWTDEQREAFLQFQFDAQNSHYRGQYPQANFQIIETADEPVGRLYVSRESNLIRILDITVLPEHRSAGIGTTLVQEIIAEANRNGQAVTIWIEQDNPAQGMFQRLGFQPTQNDGYNVMFEYRSQN